jgi:hypothetical protein
MDVVFVKGQYRVRGVSRAVVVGWGGGGSGWVRDARSD